MRGRALESKRWLAVAGAVALLAGTSSCAEEPLEAEANVSQEPRRVLGTFLAANTADLPTRCPEARLEWQTKPLCVGHQQHGARGQGSGADLTLEDCDPQALVDEGLWPNVETVLYDGMLLSDIRRFPELIHFTQAMDYYQNRKAVQEALKSRIAQLSHSRQDRAWGNYSVFLVYAGEFEEVIATFGPGGPEADRGQSDPNIVFDLAHSYFRLGRFEESHPYALRAHAWIPGHDTKWQLMLTELGVYGEEFLQKASTDLYSLKHVKAVFEARDASRIPFEDVTADAGLHIWGGYGGVNFADINGDGWDDLMAEYKFFPPRIYLNKQGKGWETLADEKMGNNMCSPVIWSPADYDNDGDRDVARNCCNYDSTGDLVFMKNQLSDTGELSFADAGDEANLHVPTERYPGAGSGMMIAWGDYDLDSYVDLLVADFTGPVRLHRNNGDGTFTEVQEEAGMDSPGSPTNFGSLGVSFGDFNDDGWPDIWAQGWGWKRLYRNNTDGTFTDVTVEAGLIPAKTEEKGYITFTFDYDNDGDIDLFAGAFVTSDKTPLGVEAVCGCHKLLTPDGYDPHEWRTASTIYRNNGDGTFTNMSEKTRFVPFGAMGSNASDWNNDGYQDVIICSGGSYYHQAEPVQFYQNNGGDGTFDLLTPFDQLGLWGKAHGAAFADYDRDGHLDLFLNSGGFMPGDVWPSRLYHNTGQSQNNWLEVKPVAGLPGTNRDAIGAKVRIYYGDGEQQVQELWAGSRFGATNSFRLHFGLAKHQKVDRIVVEWPNKSRAETEIHDVRANQAVAINETDGTHEVLWSTELYSDSAE